MPMFVDQEMLSIIMRDTRAPWASVRRVPCVASDDLDFSLVSTIFFSNSAVLIRRPGGAWASGQQWHPGGAKRRADGDHRRARQPGLFCDQVIRDASLGQQNHSAFLGHLLWRCSGTDQRFQLPFGGVTTARGSGGGKHVASESWPTRTLNIHMGGDARTKGS